MKTLLAAIASLFLLILSSQAYFNRDERRLQGLVSPQVFAAFDEYRAVKGRYPVSLSEIADQRLSVLKAEPRIGYVTDKVRRDFELYFRQPGALAPSQWDIRSDRREWSLDR